MTTLDHQRSSSMSVAEDPGRGAANSPAQSLSQESTWRTIIKPPTREVDEREAARLNRILNQGINHHDWGVKRINLDTGRTAPQWFSTTETYEKRLRDWKGRRWDEGTGKWDAKAPKTYTNALMGAIQSLLPQYNKLDTAHQILGRINEKKKQWIATGAEKQGGLSDSLNKARESADQAFRSIGQALLPVVQGVGTAIKEIGPIVTMVAGLVGDAVKKIVELFTWVVKVSDKAGEAIGTALYGSSKKVSSSQHNDFLTQLKQAELAKRRAEQEAAKTPAQREAEAKAAREQAEAAVKEAAAAKDLSTHQQKAVEAKEKAVGLQLTANAAAKTEFTTMADIARQAALRALDVSNAQFGDATSGQRAMAGEQLARAEQGNGFPAEALATLKSMDDKLAGLQQQANQEAGYFKNR